MTLKTGWMIGAAMALALAGACGKKTELAPDAAGTADAPASASAPAAKPVDGQVTLTAPATAVAGAQIEAAFTAPANAKDYIDLVPRGYAQTSGEIAYAYVETAADGKVKLRAPTAAGDYDVRYVLDMGTERTVKATSPLTVTAPAATLTAPATLTGGAAFDVTWTGPAGDGDYIDIVPAGTAETSGELKYAYTREGSPAKLRAPGKTGDYDVRYLLEGPGGRKVIAKSTIKITQPTATLKSSDSVAPGAGFIVSWTGPNGDGDYIDLVKKDYLATSGELSYFYVGPKVKNELKAPAEAGEYDVRYILEAPGGRIVLAKKTITVK